MIWGWYNRPILAAVPSGISLTSLRTIKKIIQLKSCTHLYTCNTL
jgi:hypothetical protein